jgi:hypothetical protein
LERSILTSKRKDIARQLGESYGFLPHTISYRKEGLWGDYTPKRPFVFLTKNKRIEGEHRFHKNKRMIIKRRR